MSVLNEDQLLGAPGSSQYQIQRSLRFNSADSAYLSRTPASAGNRKTWTWSGWVKRSALTDGHLFTVTSGITDSTYLRLWITNNRFYFGAYSVSYRGSTAYLRDPSAWYHLVCAVDTTQAVGANRIRLYINGVEVSSYVEYADPAQNADLAVNQATAHYIGMETVGSGFFNGYLADVHFIDGQALTPASFGETDATTGEWIPKAYTGTYGTNGFKLNFADNSAATAAALGKDTSPNGNNWTPNNLSVTAGAGNDSLVDTPTSYGTDTGVGGEVRGNYCTWNPLVNFNSSTLTDGNLDITCASVNAQWRTQKGGWGFYGGKFYFEATLNASGGNDQSAVGIGQITLAHSGNVYPGQAAGSYSYTSGGGKVDSGSITYSWATWTTGNVIGVAADLIAGTVAFYKNGTLQGSMTGLDTTLTHEVLVGSASSIASQYSLNFGQRPFAYTAPSGFKALCDTNLPAPTIVKPSTVMDVKLYTGNGGTQTISGLGFSPDLAWFKCRSNAFDHQLYDTVRGATNLIYSNSTAAEGVVSNGLTAFNSDGVSIGSVTGINSNTATYAAWCWDAGSSTVTNTAGTIQSSVRANASAGFSIVSFSFPSTGPSTIGHGLNAPPSLVIVKSRSISINWIVGHSSAAWTSFLNLNTTAASSTNSTAWNDTAPSSTVVTLGSGFVSGNYGANGVAYCFAPVAGYSAFGSYTGNGSADGPFVYTGFRPRWVMIKATTSVTFGNWMLFDTARNPSNTANLYLQANASTAEGVGGSSEYLNILSNGFKLIATPDSINGSAATYIYAAFAEFPFQYARAR